MKIVKLKDDKEINIETWNFEQLEKYSLENIKPLKNGETFQGFNLFRPSSLNCLKCHRDVPYKENQNLTPLEIQTERHLDNIQYHRALIAFHKKELCGIYFLKWIKNSENFWHYHPSYLEVHQKYKNKGLGTNLVKALDKSNFLNSKILMLGTYTYEGELYIEKIVNKELKAKNYALITYYYESSSPPLKPGIY